MKDENQGVIRDKIRNLRASTRNHIAIAVSQRIPKEEMNYSEAEEAYYDILTEEATEHEKVYGFWPTFEMEEIEYDDPILDIYGD